MGCCFGDEGGFGDPYIPDDRSPKILHDKFKQDIELYKGLDIYQMSSLASINEEDSCVKYCYYFKSLVLLIMQPLLLIAVIYQNINNSDDNHQETQDIISTICGFSLSLFVSLNIWKILWNIDHRGLYKIWSKTFDDCPNYVNPCWIFIGFYVNFLNLFIALIAFNIIIIFLK